FDFRHRRGITEDEPLPARAVNAYAASKRAAEDVVRAAASQGQDCVILRPRGIIGPWDQALAPRLARVARRGRVPLPGGGRAQVDVTCMDNVVDALLAAAQAGPQVRGRAYNISNGAPLSVAELVSAALDAMGIRARLVPLPVGPAIAAARLLEGVARVTGGWEPPVTAYSLALLAYDQTLDISAARRDLGWQPRQSVADGLAALGRWWRDQHG
ncbi:MAG TPA: NAD-dependent epimerase/dehydratase family protein, partial [Magnetospirillum sp.]|nr:NAD-dependent epimerase/dehydratase family protein [Magnetospirillum sp.]